MKKLTFISVFVMVIGICFTVNAFAEFYVIPVNNKCGPCKGTRSAGGRWCDNGDGTVTDMTACLVWLKYTDWGGAKKWEDCSSHDDAHTRAGILASGETIFVSGETTVKLTDGSVEGKWRLPTLTELSHIINEGGETVWSSNMQLFEGVQTDYWSSTTPATLVSYARAISLTDGNPFVVGKQFTKYVWPVRDGF